VAKLSQASRTQQNDSQSPRELSKLGKAKVRLDRGKRIGRDFFP
jgi:hypothetical protein